MEAKPKEKGTKNAITQAMEGYFARCDETRERFAQKSGGFSERQIPYTLYGLALAVGMNPRRLLQLVRGEGGPAWKGRLLLAGVTRIAAYTMERALLGELNYQTALSALKELGLSEAGEEAGEGTLEVVLDREGEALSQ